MSQQLAIDTIQQALFTALWAAVPILVVLFIAGIAISLLQILTSIQDPSFGAVPRLAICFVTILVALPWMVMRLVNYTERLWGEFAKYAR